MSDLTGWRDRLGALRGRLAKVLEPLLHGCGPVALIDFPRYANVGDSAIWAGQVQFLASLGIRPVYTCDQKTYDRRALAKRIGDGTILLTGGGNFGDLYPRHQELREQIISSFPENPIIQLPQSVHFEDRAKLDRARSVYDRHARLTLLLRDRWSLETAATAFDCRTELCPDMAFWLPPLPQPHEPSSEAVWLMRDDDEAIPTFADGVPAAVTTDWTHEPRTLAFRLYVWFSGAALRSATASHALQRPLQGMQDRVAMGRVARGCAMLGQARVVVTDRLHGHILCALLAIPHVLLDNRYGKNGNFYETWTVEWELARWADSPGDARTLVESFDQAGVRVATAASEQVPFG
jgi:pyruvyl transferase EpsO